MDNHPDKHRLLGNAVAAAKALGLDITVAELEPKARDQGGAGRLRLRVDGQVIEFVAQVKRGLRPATLGAALLALERLGPDALLVTDYVTPQLADALRERGVAFLDAAGNAYVHRPPVLVWVKGQRPEEKLTPLTVGRAFQATGLQAVFALLCRPELVTQPYREIATLAGVAHGTVGVVMADLAQEGFVVALGEAGRRLRNRRRLLDIWMEAYARTLRPKLLLGRYQAPAGDWWEPLDVAAYEAQFGAEPAAAKLEHYLRPGITTLYAEKVPTRLLADHRLRTDPAGDVEIRKRFWIFNYPWNHPDLVPPVLIYADLLATGDARCMEAAKRVYELYLAELIDQE